MAFNFHLSSLNVRGLGETFKRRSIFHWLRKFHAGISFLQETHSTTESEKIWRSEWGANIIFSHGTSNSRGVAILLPNNLDYVIQKEINDSNGRYLILDTLIDNTRLILVNVYAPTKKS